jgi:TetR/AcrR family transcriptional repressor of lmrAB and yxaGH operons
MMAAMAPRDSRTSRQRVVDATLLLLRRQGLAATGMNEIVRDSRAPRGSIYHHFPGGKDELVVEALRAGGAAVATLIRDTLAAHADATVALRAFIAIYVQNIRDSDYQQGCPVGNAAMDVAASSAAIRRVCEEIFAGWVALMAEGLRRDGIRPSEAEALAEFMLSSLEGALILCRAQRSTQPLERVADRMEAIIRTAARRPNRRETAGRTPRRRATRLSRPRS